MFEIHIIISFIFQFLGLCAQGIIIYLIRPGALVNRQTLDEKVKDIKDKIESTSNQENVESFITMAYSLNAHFDMKSLILNASCPLCSAHWKTIIKPGLEDWEVKYHCYHPPVKLEIDGRPGYEP